MPRASNDNTEQQVLQTAIDLSSRHGLEGLTIGQLARHMNMSKSGVFGYFGSKEKMQLSILDAVADIFVDEVIQPARNAPQYMLIWNYCDRWLDYMERDVFPGGCFILSAASEFDGRTGNVHDKVAELNHNWTLALRQAADQAIHDGQLSADVDRDQLVFELTALGIGANWAHQTLSQSEATRYARRAIWQRLHPLARTPDALPAAPQ